MLTRQPWRRLVHRFSAVTVLLSVLSTGSVALAPRGGAATTGPAAANTARGVQPPTSQAKIHIVLLCQTSHINTTMALRNQESDLEKATVGKLECLPIARCFTSEQTQSQTAKAVINVGRGVPANVSTAARQEVKNVVVLNNSFSGRRTCRNSMRHRTLLEVARFRIGTRFSTMSRGNAGRRSVAQRTTSSAERSVGVGPNFAPSPGELGHLCKAC